MRRHHLELNGNQRMRIKQRNVLNQRCGGTKRSFQPHQRWIQRMRDATKRDGGTPTMEAPVMIIIRCGCKINDASTNDWRVLIECGGALQMECAVWRGINGVWRGINGVWRGINGV
ncbi:hypothetical protein AVEN_139487-1 [Araneus ventricosus]|uniref:Uncharacterized protein n=1 Tax=Araneus ventricosus TaxID=182803 RepID=A0A4Y2UTE4_ARAVE|nr:hypothetical protein AVEN_139487-1 [Araneus ventricosus]